MRSCARRHRPESQYRRTWVRVDDRPKAFVRLQPTCRASSCDPKIATGCRRAGGRRSRYPEGHGVLLTPHWNARLTSPVSTRRFPVSEPPVPRPPKRSRAGQPAESETSESDVEVMNRADPVTNQASSLRASPLEKRPVCRVRRQPTPKRSLLLSVSCASDSPLRASTPASLRLRRFSRP